MIKENEWNEFNFYILTGKNALQQSSAVQYSQVQNIRVL